MSLEFLSLVQPVLKLGKKQGYLPNFSNLMLPRVSSPRRWSFIKIKSVVSFLICSPKPSEDWNLVYVCKCCHCSATGYKYYKTDIGDKLLSANWLSSGVTWTWKGKFVSNLFEWAVIIINQSFCHWYNRHWCNRSVCKYPLIFF